MHFFRYSFGYSPKGVDFESCTFLGLLTRRTSGKKHKLESIGNPKLYCLFVFFTYFGWDRRSVGWFFYVNNRNRRSNSCFGGKLSCLVNNL